MNASQILDKLLEGQRITIQLYSEQEAVNLLGRLRSLKAKKNKQMKEIGFSISDQVIRYECTSDLMLSLWLGESQRFTRTYNIISVGDT